MNFGIIFTVSAIFGRGCKCLYIQLYGISLAMLIFSDCKPTVLILDCDVVELDLQFLVDGSSSIQDDDFNLAKDWIQSLISKFNIGQYTTRVGKHIG